MDEQIKGEVLATNQEAPKKGRRKRKEEPKEGLALKKWGLFFFVLSCISVALVAASLARFRDKHRNLKEEFILENLKAM